MRNKGRVERVDKDGLMILARKIVLSRLMGEFRLRWNLKTQ